MKLVLHHGTQRGNKPVTQPVTVRQVRIAPRRFTRWAALAFGLYFCLPVLAICALVDLALYTVVTGWLGRCYAVLCLFD